MSVLEDARCHLSIFHLLQNFFSEASSSIDKISSKSDNYFQKSILSKSMLYIYRVYYTPLGLVTAELQKPKYRTNLLYMPLVSNTSNLILYLLTRFFQENLKIRILCYESFNINRVVKFLSGNNRKFGSFP